MKNSQRHYLAYVGTLSGNAKASIPGAWRTMSGGGAEAEVTRDYDGGSEVPDLLPGIPEYADLELTRTVDEVRDAAWLAQVRQGVGRLTATISRHPTDVNMVPVGKPVVYPGCVLVGFTEPESDASSGDAAEVTLTFATRGPAK